MLKLPKWVRLIIGALAIFASLCLSWWLEKYLADMAMFLILPGAAMFIVLNPELMRGD